ncbi:dicarboxylate/amino acid:cation symporter [Zobellella maritima]|uniref:dicarboxylate/amino acid:cation symporter n=1 Tax=Zobellella maritima TaxID=2059725 RepID=UPI000E304320|nr:dicarboxylate/amino acid:cation symporter [Zobellella maritima]
MAWWKKQKLYIKILIGAVLGISVGIIGGENATLLSPIGEIFIRLLQTVIVPLVFFSLVAGITQLESMEKLKTVGFKTVSFYCLTAFFATLIGVSMALLLSPGKSSTALDGMNAVVEAADPTAGFSFIDNLVQWVPNNPIAAMAEGSMLQIIIFSIIMGLALVSLGERGKPLVTLFQRGSELSIRMAELVVTLAPYGIFALMANASGSFGSDFLIQALRYVIADISGLAVILLVVYPALILSMTRTSPLKFYKQCSSAMLVAASTTSSGATLPATIAVARDEMKISERIYGFTLPLGATVNMNGMSVVLGVIAVFAANVHGTPITMAFLATTIFLGIFLAAGTAGTKGADIVMASVLLTTLGFPLTLLPIIAALSPLLDMGHTVCNITGDLVATRLVADAEEKSAELEAAVPS